LAGYLCARNEIYLAKKHFGIGVICNTVCFGIIRAILFNVNVWLKRKTYEEKRYFWYFLIGVLAGIFNVSKIPAIKK
jgi:uncharacterized membrane protein